MTSPAAQDENGPVAVAGVCPRCGAMLQPRAGGFVAMEAEPSLGPSAVWHLVRPNFPPPPGCRRIRVPLRGYLDVDDDTRRSVEQFFNVPMLALALLVLPLLVVDYYVSRGQDGQGWLTWGVMIAHIAISMAFLAEFVVKISIAQSRLGYLGRNWIDLIIIILPFLRPLQGVRAIRVLRPLQVARVVQVSRVYAMRGVGLKAVRTMIPVLLGLRFTQRFRRAESAPAGRPDYSKWPRSALLLEIERLERLLQAHKKNVSSTENGPGAGANT